jgi:FkbM family methyltransferase
MGIANVRLAAVEADPMHYEWLREHLANNGLDPTEHQLWCGAVGASDGIAYFPKIDDPAVDWGAPAVSEQGMQDLLQAGKRVDRRGQEFREVKCYSIASVIAAFDRIDLLHIDIQGQELDSIRSSIRSISEKVRLMFIGTHDTVIDAELIRFLTRNGWEAKHIWPRDLMRGPDGRPAGIADGEQFWINNSLS